MEDLTAPPVLMTLRELKWRLSSGQSTREALRTYLDGATSPFSHQIREWWALKNQNRPVRDLATEFPTHAQRALLALIERGCAGQPILEPLAALEEEVEGAAEAELSTHIQTLPFRMLVPLLLFQFPAFLLLLLGPLLRELSSQIGGAR